MFNIIYLFQVLSGLRKFVTIAILNIEKEHFNELRETGRLVLSRRSRWGRRTLSRPALLILPVGGCKGQSQGGAQRRDAGIDLQAAIGTTLVPTSYKCLPAAWLTTPQLEGLPPGTHASPRCPPAPAQAETSVFLHIPA